jgi:excisionase family DNA binding protein
VSAGPWRTLEVPTLKVGEAAERLNVSPQTVRNMVRDGRLRAEVSGGKHRRIPVADVEALLPTLPARPLPRS